ncbi:hypothetical protein FOZ60_002807 [Perkinsus olseni]|uniref:Peptidase A1 domain-containing protein n=1 Tax=Perkinsus olseni TaxID=32597 RepID=A0A7J6NXW1_PEROL|nr:hypothetical protein FOZ60_002807 [Perkinsus olseni]
MLRLLQVGGIIKLPVFYEEYFLRTELLLDGEMIHPVVDTGSISFHAIDRNSFPDWCQRYPYNCCRPLQYELGAPGTRGMLKKYFNWLEEMRPVEGQVAFVGASGFVGLGMRLHAVVHTYSWSIVEGWVSGGTNPEASLGLGFPRTGSDTVLEQLLASGVISHALFSIRLPANFTENAVSGYDELNIGTYALVDSGDFYLAGPPEEAGKLITEFVGEANSGRPEQIVHSTPWGPHWLHCNDAEYLPDLTLRFSTIEGIANTVKIRGKYLVEFRRIEGAPRCILAIERREGWQWTLGVPLFRNRTIRFDARGGSVGLVLEESTAQKQD